MRTFVKSITVTAVLLWSGLVSNSFAQLVWDTRGPSTTNVNLNGVTWGANKYVAVGASGSIWTSSDTGKTWIIRASTVLNTKSLYSVASSNLAGANSQVVAVGQEGIIVASADGGATWSSVTSNTLLKLSGVTWSSALGMYVAVGDAGTIVTSTNGTTWTSRTSGATDALYAVAWSPGASRFVAVGNNGATVTSTDGINWSVVTGNTTVLYSIVWTGSEFIATGSSGVIRASASGTSGWGARTSGVGSGILLLGATYGGTGGGRLAIVGSAGNIRQSTDGSTWSAGTSGTTITLNSVAANGAGFIAVGASGLILSSTDGTSWTQVSSYITSLNGITARFATAAGDTQFVAVGAVGMIIGSSNGITWTKRTTSISSDFYSVAAGGTLAAPALAIVGNGASATATSTDGVTWTSRTMPTPVTGTSNVMFAVAGNTVAAPTTTFVAVGSGGTIFYSTNAGSTWAEPTTPNNVDGLNAIAYNPTGTVWVAVGDNGAVRRATNPATTWTSTIVSGTTNSLRGITYVPAPVGLFVAVGLGGTILTSTTGAANTWNPSTSGVTATLRSVTWTGSLIVVSGDNGLILTSPNGASGSWTTQTTGVTSNLLGVKWDGKQVAAVGAGGRIITSSPAALPPVPTTQYPSVGLTGVPINPAFTWTSSSGSLSYGVQVSVSSNFASLVIDATTPTNALSYTAGPLNPGASYYWRVRANGSTGSSAYSSGTQFTTITVDSSAPVDSFPAANATGVATSLTFAWKVYPGATKYRLQVSTDSTFATTLVNDSTLTGNTRLVNLSTLTVYYWRIAAILSTGTTAWSATKRFTTTAPTPATPVLSTPIDSAIAFPLTNGKLKWAVTSGATEYRVQVSATSAFSTFVKDTIIQADSLVLPALSANGVYFWHVQARNASGGSAYSSTRTFTTATTITTKPTLGLPANNANPVSVFTDLTWQAVTGASIYQLQLSTDSTFATSLINDSSLTVLTRNVGTLANSTIYYWRVRAKNPAGNGPYSDRRVFTSGQIPTTTPAAPVLVSPDNFVTNVSAAAAAFKWKVAATATLYRLQISTDPTFTPANTIVYNDSTIADTTKTVTTLTGGVNYYWRVNGKNNVGFGTLSEVRAFTTVATVPAVPVLTFPAQFDTGISVTPTLTWGAVPGATAYRLQVSNSAGVFTGTALLVNDSITTAFRTLSTLANNTNYFWQVRAINAAGTSVYSTARRFTTGIAPLPAVPVLISPAQFATGVSLASPVTLKWGRVSGASTYQVLLSTQPFTTGAVIVLQDSTVTDTTRSVTGLLPLTDYFWKVSARSSAGSGEFSGIFKFTTDQGTSILGADFAGGTQSMANAGVLRFGLTDKEHVIIRMYNTQGRKIALDFDKTLESGIHTIPLPEELRGSFFLIEFKAGNVRQILKVHP